MTRSKDFGLRMGASAISPKKSCRVTGLVEKWVAATRLAQALRAKQTSSCNKNKHMAKQLLKHRTRPFNHLTSNLSAKLLIFFGALFALLIFEALPDEFQHHVVKYQVQHHGPQDAAPQHPALQHAAAQLFPTAFLVGLKDQGTRKDAHLKAGTVASF